MARKNNPDQPKPWAALGISESTYYRRKRAGTLSADCQTKVEKTVKATVKPARKTVKAKPEKTVKPKTVTVKSVETVKRDSEKAVIAETVTVIDVDSAEPAKAAADEVSTKGKPHRFSPGNNANPAGRPKGSRNKITEAFVSEMCAHFQQHGLDAIERVFRDKPDQYLNAIVRLVPQQVEVGEAGAFDGMSDDELDTLLAQRMASLQRHQADNSRWMQ